MCEQLTTSLLYSSMYARNSICNSYVKYAVRTVYVDVQGNNCAAAVKRVILEEDSIKSDFCLKTFSGKFWGK